MNISSCDHVGKTFGRLLVISSDSPRRKKKYLCRCECGVEKSILASSVVSGHTKSCGCLNTDTRRESKTTHGKSGTKTHSVWRSMIQRCTNKKDKAYGNYGGRGISVCKRWGDYSNFIADMGEKPEGYAIDRIDNSKGYSPDNCRWVTRQENQNNMRSNRLIEFNGIVKTIAQWERFLGFRKNEIRTRLHVGWTITRAFTTPVKHYKKREQRQ